MAYWLLKSEPDEFGIDDLLTQIALEAVHDAQDQDDLGHPDSHHERAEGASASKTHGDVEPPRTGI